MIEMVIKIPEEMYKWVYDVNKFFDDYGTVDFMDLIKNGTPLPEHHGDLVDRDAIEVLRIGIIKREYDKGFDAGVSCMVNRILETPTIIEADRGSKDNACLDEGYKG